MRRSEEARYRELVARARVLLPTLDEQRIHEVQAVLEVLLGADRLNPRVLTQLERLIDNPP